MPKVRIYHQGLNKTDLDTLVALVKDAGVPATSIEFLKNIPPPDDECGDEVIVFPLTRGVVENGEFDAQIAKVPDGGRRAICVWPADVTDATPPDAARKFSYSIVSWNVERLRAALTDDDSVCFETPSGEVLKAPDTERLCEEEPE